MLFREKVGFLLKNHTGDINRFCGRKYQLFNVQSADIRSNNHHTVMDWGIIGPQVLKERSKGRDISLRKKMCRRNTDIRYMKEQCEVRI
jgi:hypothetical protein